MDYQTIERRARRSEKRRKGFTYFCLTEHPELYAPDGDAPDLVDVPERIG